MKFALSAAVLFVALAVSGFASATPSSPNLLNRLNIVDAETLVVKAHHKRGHVGGRGKHLGWYKKNRGKHKGWR